ncbi:Type I restriction modification DNA specificity domain protein [anaerobic digester metagenome]
MNKEWQFRSIRECAADTPYSTQIGPFGNKIKAEIYTPIGVPVLRGVNVNKGRFNDNDNDFVFISEEYAKELAAFECNSDDVILVHKGTLGKIGIIPHNCKYPRYIMGNSMMRVKCNPKKLIPLFLYYWLTSDEGQKYIFSRVSQVGVPQIQKPLSTLREASFRCPPLPTQKAIAHILGTLDDKIELNRRMNETLESIARAIFKSWFIDFDPVRAKAEGRQPEGMDAATAALFPSEFETVEGQEIPKGWKIKTLGDIAYNFRENITAEKLDENIPYIALEHMPRKSIALSEWAYGDVVESNKSQFNKGDILFGKLRPYFHKVGIAPINGVCSTDILVIRPNIEHLHSFVICLVSSDDFVSHSNLSSTGTKMPRCNWKDMAKYQVILPQIDILKIFDKVISINLKLIIHQIFEIRTLSSVRDTLLPKLLSGELPITNPEQFTGVS